MNVGGLDRPFPPFPSSKNGVTEEGHFFEVLRPGCRCSCAVSLRLRELSGAGCRGRARSVHPWADPQPARTAEPFGLGVLVPEARAPDVPRPHRGWKKRATTKGLRFSKSGAEMRDAGDGRYGKSSDSGGRFQQRLGVLQGRTGKRSWERPVLSLQSGGSLRP